MVTEQYFPREVEKRERKIRSEKDPALDIREIFNVSCWKFIAHTCTCILRATHTHIFTTGLKNDFNPSELHQATDSTITFMTNFPKMNSTILNCTGWNYAG